MSNDISKFDDISLRNIQVFLNYEGNPYADMFFDFDTNKFATLNNMYASFQEPYYLTKKKQPIFNPKEFKHAPIAHIYCSYKKNTATTADITAYCLVLQEKRFTYNPLNKIVL